MLSPLFAFTKQWINLPTVGEDDERKNFERPPTLSIGVELSKRNIITNEEAVVTVLYFNRG